MAENMVTYTGGARNRVITAAQWDQAGIKGQDETRWDPTNMKKLKKSDFNKDALEVLKRSPKEFRIDGDEVEENRPVPKQGPNPTPVSQ